MVVVPLPSQSPTTGRSPGAPNTTVTSGAPATCLWMRYQRTLLRLLLLIALPIVFGIGFWTRGAVEPVEREIAGADGNDSAPLVSIVNHQAEGNARDIAAIPAAGPTVDGVPALPEKNTDNDSSPTPRILVPPAVSRPKSRPAEVALAENEHPPRGALSSPFDSPAPAHG